MGFAYAPGDVLTAEAMNALRDDAELLQRSTQGGSLQIGLGPRGVTLRGRDPLRSVEAAIAISALNIGGSDLLPFDVGQISEPVQLQSGFPSHTGNPLLDQFIEEQRVLEVLSPLDSCFGRFCVCAEAIPQDKVGSVWVSGVCLTRIARYNKVMAASWAYKKPDRADTMRGQTYLQAGEIGAAQILWLQDPFSESEDPKWGVIRFDSRQTAGIGLEDASSLKNRGVCEVIQLSGDFTVSVIGAGVVKVEHS